MDFIPEAEDRQENELQNHRNAGKFCKTLHSQLKRQLDFFPQKPIVVRIGGDPNFVKKKIVSATALGNLKLTFMEIHVR